jgi:hypothetical protein
MTGSPNGSVAGACYGFEVRSTFAFQYLRAPGDATALHIVERAAELRPAEDPVIEWVRQPGHPLHAKLYTAGERFRLWTDLEGWFEIDPSHPEVSLPPCLDAVRREERLWGIPITLCYQFRGDFGIHAASVDVNGSALAFAAPGRFGKTTLAGAFLAAGHRVLSEDFTCFRLTPSPALLPGPAMLRVRRDVFDRLEFPATYTVAEEPDRVHLAVDEAHRGDGAPVPIRAVLFLRESADGYRMERLTADQAILDLWSLSFKLPTDRDRERCFGDLVTLANRIPVYNVHRPLTFEALPQVIDMILTTCLPS